MQLLKSTSNRARVPWDWKMLFGPLDECKFASEVVNWTLRQVGRRNRELNKLPVAESSEIRCLDSKSVKG
jgi:hypothetical protein